MTTAVDLFAGAGGFSQGARAAGVHVAWAANHWPTAVQWHAANHPETAHACQDLQQCDFREAPRHDILLASPACQGHSKARGTDKPHHDAQRSTAWAVITCAEVHRPQAVVVENVPEFTDWTLYPAWCAAMHALGYALNPMVVDAADHGVPQHRRRLFVVATRSKSPVQLRLQRREHVPIGSFIDWTAGRWLPIERAGRSARTLQRVANGRARFGARFVMPYYGSGSGLTGRSIDRPLGTVTTRARWGLVDGDQMRMLSASEARGAMGFPADYRLPPQPAQALHLLGNAVCPPVAADIVSSLMGAV